MKAFYLIVFCLSAPVVSASLATFDELLVGSRLYRNVVVNQITPESLIIQHSRGLAQVKLRDLSPELQSHFGYNPDREAAFKATKQSAKPVVKAHSPKPDAPSQPRALERFGTPAKMLPEVDLRPTFREFDFYVKSQGRRPSCSVFAVVSALEYENAKATGQPERLSEDYLIWATRESLGISNATDADYDPGRDGDLGFTLIEVVQALRRYGIPTEDAMPNTFGKGMAKIEPPDPLLIDDARTRRQIEALYVTGRTPGDKIENIIHLLNDGIPVVIGIGWPHSATLRNAPLLSKQSAQYGHAVTLVGYVCESGTEEDLRFLFKNSWGPKWGIAGHGWITYEYMKKHLGSAVYLNVGR